MKPHHHPRITVAGIILSFVLNISGALIIESTGNAMILFIGLILFAIVSIDIVVDRNRRLVTVFSENTDK